MKTFLPSSLDDRRRLDNAWDVRPPVATRRPRCCRDRAPALKIDNDSDDDNITSGLVLSALTT